MTWIATFTGGKFDFADIENAEIDIADIAHALSNICRFGGHCQKFYSVAEHSYHLANYFLRRNDIAAKQSAELAIAALWHDAPEAYIGDIVAPLKCHLQHPVYSNGAFKVESLPAIEDAVWRRICKVYGLPVKIPPAVKQADARICVTEAKALNQGWDTDTWWFGYSTNEHGEKVKYYPTPLENVEIKCWTPAHACRKWCGMYSTLARLAETHDIRNRA